MTDNGGGASRTTEPALGTSTATDVSLREYLCALLDEAEKRENERFRHMKETVEAAFASAQTAITKADIATEKRFEGVNEFRAALSDQAAQFITRDSMNSLADKLNAQIERNREDIDGLSKRLDLREGQSAGSRLTGGYVVTVATLGIGVIVMLVVLATYLGSR